MNLNDAWRSGHRWFRLAGTGHLISVLSEVEQFSSNLRRFDTNGSEAHIP